MAAADLSEDVILFLLGLGRRVRRRGRRRRRRRRVIRAAGDTATAAVVRTVVLAGEHGAVQAAGVAVVLAEVFGCVVDSVALRGGAVVGQLFELLTNLEDFVDLCLRQVLSTRLGLCGIICADLPRVAGLVDPVELAAFPVGNFAGVVRTRAEVVAVVMVDDVSSEASVQVVRVVIKDLGDNAC